jgi:hypothetical protein
VRINIWLFTLTILFSLLVISAILQRGFSLVIANNPFARSDSEIKSVKRTTSDGRLLVDLEYSPEVARKGELTFFKVNLFDNTGDKQNRTRHVDCDLIIMKDKTELFKTSTQYGELLYHAINGVFLASFPFNETGKYTVSVEVAGIFFVPIKPAFANFTVTVAPTSDGNLKINLM